MSACNMLHTPYFFLEFVDDMLHHDVKHILSNRLQYPVVKFFDHVTKFAYIWAVGRRKEEEGKIIILSELR